MQSFHFVAYLIVTLSASLYFEAILTKLCSQAYPDLISYFVALRLRAKHLSNPDFVAHFPVTVDEIPVLVHSFAFSTDNIIENLPNLFDRQ